MTTSIISKDNDPYHVPSAVQMEYKEIDEGKGTFSGYGAVFGNRDDGWDIIEKNAFKKFRHVRGTKSIRIAAFHDTTRLIGTAEVEQDEKGLRVKGQLDFDLDGAKQIFYQMKSGLLDAMSVGFNILKDGATWSDDYSTRTITKAELFEVSVVAFGMNSKARITSVKSGGITDIRHFESAMRDLGFSRKEATAIASHGFRSLQSDSVVDAREILDIKHQLAGIEF